MLRFYAALLRLYPKAFREEYEREMTLAFRDRWHAEPGVATALATVGDTVATALQVQASLLWQDLRYGVRSLRRDRGFSLPAIGTLALGIGAATAMFTLVWSVLLRPLPFAEPGRVVALIDTNVTRRIDSFASSLPNVADWRTRSRLLAEVAAFRSADFNLATGPQAERVAGFEVLPSFWRTTGQQPLVGRLFRPEENTPGRHRVVVLGESLWRERFQADLGVLGRPLTLNGAAYTIIGVAPSRVGYSNDVGLFVPLTDAEPNRGDRNVSALGRLRPGVSARQAEDELNAIAAGLEREYPRQNEGWRLRVLPLVDSLVEPSLRQGLAILLGAVGLLLVIACVNVASLLLARAASRGKEIGIRLSLGASRARLVRQFTTESLLLGLCGGLAGIALAWVVLRSLSPFLPTNLPGIDRLELEWPVLAFALAATLVATLLFGVAPAWQSIQLTNAPRRLALRRVLVAGQLALATLLVAGALLLLASFSTMVRQDLGFRRDHLLIARFSPPQEERWLSQAELMIAEIKAIPGVLNAGITSEVPFGGFQTQLPVIAAERAADLERDGIQANWRVVTGSYLPTLGVPLLAGRWWQPRENWRERPILVSRDLALRLFPDGRDPVGRRIRLGNGHDFTIIGVTGELRHLTLTDTGATATMYMPTRFTMLPSMGLVVRTAGSPAALTPALRDIMRRIDPHQPLFDVRTMETHLSEVASAPRLAAVILGAFAVLAALLGAIGVAGLVAYSVAGQRRELAVRLAIGATPARVIRTVAGGHFRLCCAGLASGLLAAWLARPLIATLLFGVDAGDARFFLATGAALGIAAAAACWWPARRISRLDPVAILRSE